MEWIIFGLADLVQFRLAGLESSFSEVPWGVGDGTAKAPEILAGSALAKARHATIFVHKLKERVCIGQRVLSPH